MDGVGIAAIITATVALLGTLGAAVRYVVQLILDAYKQQVESTEKAKDAEIAALHARIDRHQAEISFLRDQVLTRLGGRS